MATGEFELSPIAMTVYVIIVLIIIWPLAFKLIKKLLPAKAAAAVEAVSEEPALQIAEHHHVDVPTQTDEVPSQTENKEKPK